MTKKLSGPPMALVLDSFLQLQSSSDDDDDLDGIPYRTIEEILNDSDSSSSSSSSSFNSAELRRRRFSNLSSEENSNSLPKEESRFFDEDASVSSPETLSTSRISTVNETFKSLETLKSLQLEEKSVESKISSFGRRKSGEFSGNSFSLGRSSSRPFSPLFGGVKPNAKPGAALAAAAAASRSIPTPHAAAIKWRRAGGGTLHKVLDSSVSGSKIVLDGSSVFDGLAPSDDVSNGVGSSDLGGKDERMENFQSSTAESVVRSNSNEEFPGGDEIAVHESNEVFPIKESEEQAQASEVGEIGIQSEEVLSNSNSSTSATFVEPQVTSPWAEEVLNVDENSTVLGSADVNEEQLPSAADENACKMDVSSTFSASTDFAEKDFPSSLGYEKAILVEEDSLFPRSEMPISKDEISLAGDDTSSRSDITELVEDRMVQWESKRGSKRTGKKLRSSMKPLELAEELEKKLASSGLHREEGAAAQPMRLEGIRRGPPAVGYLQIDHNNAITRTISSQAFRHDHGSPQVVAVHANFIAVGMSKGAVVIFPSKYSAHNADNMDAKMLMLSSQGDKSHAPVTSMCFNQQGDLLLVGYGDGHITVWDVHRAAVAKVITGEHTSPVVHTLFLGQDSHVTRQFKAVTGDSKGLVLLHALSVVPLLNRFSIKTQCLLDGQKTGTVLSASPLIIDECYVNALISAPGNAMASTSGIGSMVGGETGWKFFGEGSSLVEEGVVIFVTHQTALVVRLSPTLEVYAQLSRPDGVREGSMPYTAWKCMTQSREKMPGETLENASLLAIAWDRKVQVAKLVKSELKIYREWNLDSAAIGVAWLDDQMLVVLTLRGQLCLFSKEGTQLHQTSFAVDGSGGDDLIAYHTHLTNIFGNPEKAYHNCIAVRGATIYILGPMHLVVSRLLPWKERIQVLRKAGDWMGALDMAMRLYDGHAHGVIDLPRTLDAIREAIMPYLVELLLSYVDEVFSYISVAFCNQIGKMELVDDPRSRSSSVQSDMDEQFARVGGVAVEFCVHITRTDILFDDIFSKFVAVQHGDQHRHILELLEPYILKDMLGCLPPEIMQALVEHYSSKGWLQRVEQCVLHMDISSLDFNQRRTSTPTLLQSLFRGKFKSLPKEESRFFDEDASVSSPETLSTSRISTVNETFKSLETLKSLQLEEKSVESKISSFGRRKSGEFSGNSFSLGRSSSRPFSPLFGGVKPNAKPGAALAAAAAASPESVVRSNSNEEFPGGDEIAVHESNEVFPIKESEEQAQASEVGEIGIQSEEVLSNSNSSTSATFVEPQVTSPWAEEVLNVDENSTVWVQLMLMKNNYLLPQMRMLARWMEEGAAAQPMRLEGIRRGPPAVGYLQIDHNNAITRTISSQAFRHDHGSPQVVAVHANFIAVGMSKGAVVIFPSKYSAHNADNMDAKMLMLSSQGDKSHAPVTSMCFNQQGDLLLVGYGDGHITVWDVHRAAVAKVITGEHTSPVVHTLFLGQDSHVTRQFKAVTGDSKGLVLLHALSVVPCSTVLSASPLIIDECYVNALISAPGNAMASTSGIGSMVGGETGWKFFGEGSSLVEEGVVIFVTHQTALVVRLSPTLEVYAQLSRPDGVRRVPCLHGMEMYDTVTRFLYWYELSQYCFFFALLFLRYDIVSEKMPGETLENASLLAIAWDRKVQVAKLVKSELKIYREWNLDSAAIGVAWLDDQMLVVLTLRGQLCLFSKEGTQLHQTSFAVDGSGGDDLIAYHTHLTNIFGNPEKAYHNCIAVRGANIYTWANASCGFSSSPMEGTHSVLRKAVAFCNQIGKMELVDDPRSRSSSVQSDMDEQFARVGGVAVEFCVHITRTDILFDDIFSKFVAVQHGGTFLELLEPYILKDMLGCLPPEIMQALVEHYSSKGWLQRVEQCVLHMDISSLDFNQRRTSTPTLLQSLFRGKFKSLPKEESRFFDEDASVSSPETLSTSRISTVNETFKSLETLKSLQLEEKSVESKISSFGRRKSGEFSGNSFSLGRSSSRPFSPLFGGVKPNAKPGAALAAAAAASPESVVRSNSNEEFPGGDEIAVHESNEVFPIKESEEQAQASEVGEIGIQSEEVLSNSNSSTSATFVEPQVTSPWAEEVLNVDENSTVWVQLMLMKNNYLLPQMRMLARWMEEGAAAQPMRLEGIRRGPPAVGYLQIDHNNAITRTISSQAFRHDHGSPQVVAVHANFIAVGMSKGAVVIFPSKYSAHNADNMDAKMLMLSSQGDKSHAPVTSMCFNQQGDLLLVGYGDGHITVWDVHRAAVAKVITGEHTSPVVHTLFLGQDSHVTRQFKAVTGDSKGLVLLHALSVVPCSTVLSASPLIIDECYVNALISAPGNAMASTSGIGSMVGGETGWKFFGEGSSLVEEGVVIFVTHQTALVVRLSPTLEVYAQLSRPDGVRRVPCLHGMEMYDTVTRFLYWYELSQYCFFFALLFLRYDIVSEKMPGETLENASLLAIAWDRKVQVAKLVKSELKIYREWNLDSAAIGVAWLDDQMLVVLTLRGQLCLFSKEGTQLHQTSFAVDGSGGDDLIAYHTHLTNIFGNPEKAYHNCIAVRGANIYTWANASCGFSSSPMEGTHSVLRKAVAFCNQIGKMELVDDPRSRSSSVQSDMDEQFARVGGVAVEFCVHITRTDILFDDIFSKFVAVQHGGLRQ
ncbi:hypothetical protein HHK36_027376 [Tetracentron sinense]|uniref:Vacuolar protein sorting-associated protein 8 central domain-containing protein n=1 Tax=Tetracentron sinense TaxID=13715 RepID=A0A834YD46_TETSI|nr:hypothetical protein HHK36_027376 [Tetracentron sinense]